MPPGDLTDNSDSKGPVTAEVLDLALEPQHRDYLLQRHGRVDLDPIPPADDGSPYNWPTWMVCHSSLR